MSLPTSSIAPTQGSIILSNSFGLLSVRIAANARIFALGKESASLFAAPSRVLHESQHHPPIGFL